MIEKKYALKLEFTMTDSDGLEYNTSKTARLAINKKASVTEYLKFVDDIASFQKTMKKLRRKELDRISIEMIYIESDTETFDTLQSLDFYNTLKSAEDFTNGITLNAISNQLHDCNIKIKYSVDASSYGILEEFAKIDAVAQWLAAQK